jgi:4-oxalocrotonate tautomerase
MPHVIVKLCPGRSEQLKTRLAEGLSKSVMNVLNFGEEAVSVTIEEIEPQDWAKKVYDPDILDHPERVYKKPGDNPFEWGLIFPATEFGDQHQKVESRRVGAQKGVSLSRFCFGHRMPPYVRMRVKISYIRSVSSYVQSKSLFCCQRHITAGLDGHLAARAHRE